MSKPRSRSRRTNKRQSKASQVSNGSVEVVSALLYEDEGNDSVLIKFKTPKDAKAFLAEFKLQMEVDTFLNDMPEDSYSEGVLRTIKVKK